MWCSFYNYLSHKSWFIQCGRLNNDPRPRLLLFSYWVMSNSLRPHGLQHSRPPCPSLSPGIGSDSYPSSQWCHPTLTSSVAFFSCLRSFPASGYFPMSRLFMSGGQSIGTSASVLPINVQGWFPLGLPWCSDWFDLLAVQRCVLVAQSCPTLCCSMDCSLSGFSVHRIFQAIIPEWVSFSRGSSQPRDWTHVSCVSCIAGRFFIHWATGEACSEIPGF